MTRSRKLTTAITAVFAVFGLLMTMTGTADAATGAGGVPILSAATSPMVHKCNVVGGDGTWQAVVCADLITTEIGTNYYVTGQAEAMCQQVAAPHALGTCERIIVTDELFTGSGGSTLNAENSCSVCPKNGRLYVQTARWGYTIAGGKNGNCSKNVDTAYQVWGVMFNQDTQWTFPDGRLWDLEGMGANDGLNESTGHYFICP